MSVRASALLPAMASGEPDAERPAVAEAVPGPRRLRDAVVTLGLPGSDPFDDGRQSAAALAIARGTRRLLAQLGFATITELTLANGRRADVVALAAAGQIWIVEIKSSLADFQSDQKWTDYRAYCDRLVFAVAPDFPRVVLPADTGLIVADRFGGEMLRAAPEHALTGARRKAVTLLFARQAAARLRTLDDPEAAFERPPRD